MAACTNGYHTFHTYFLWTDNNIPGRDIQDRTRNAGGAGVDNMIVVNLDIMMARRKMSLGELAEKVDITPANLSIFKTGKAKAVRFSTLERLCQVLDCQPADLLEYRE